MFKTFLLSTAMVGLSSTNLLAQSFTGAALGIEYRDALDGEDLGGVTYFGSAEFDAFYGVSVALDATAYDFEIGPSGVSNLGAHVFYSVNPSTDIGLFLGRDFTDDENSGLFGAEVAYDYGGGDAEGYIGRGEDAGGRELTLFGAAGTYTISPTISLGATFDRYGGDDFSASAIEAGGFYTLPAGPKLGATIGRVGYDEDGETSDAFTFGIQASIALGTNGGTTFGRRSAFEAVKASPLAP